MSAQSEILDLIRTHPDATSEELAKLAAGPTADDSIVGYVHDLCRQLEARHLIRCVDLGDSRGWHLPEQQDQSVLRSEEDVDPRLISSLNDLTGLERRLLVAALGTDAGGAVNFPWLVHSVSRYDDLKTETKHALEMQVDRAARRLYTRGLATIEKRADNLNWLVPDRSRIAALIAKDRPQQPEGASTGFNLMRGPCVFPTQESGSAKNLGGRPRKQRDIYALPSRCSGERVAAVRLLKGVHILNRPDKAEVNLHFETYLDDINDKIIALMANDGHEVIGSEYSTRFNDVGKAAAQLDRFDAALAQSLQDYSYATFLTLTTNPNLTDGERTYYEEGVRADLRRKLQYAKPATVNKIRRRLEHLDDPDREAPDYDPDGFGSLYEANRHFSPAWNKFLAYLTKKFLGKRPTYIASYEYTETGLLHIHVLLFVRFLLPQSEIAAEWARCGQGNIAYVYALKNRRGPGGERGWYWCSAKKPGNASKMDGGDYLKKYLKKCLLAMSDNYVAPSEIQSLYWAHNKHMMSCSRCFLGAPKKIDPDAKPQYYYWKTLRDDEVADGGLVDRMVYHRIRPKEDDGAADDPPDELMPGRC